VLSQANNWAAFNSKVRNTTSDVKPYQEGRESAWSFTHTLTLAGNEGEWLASSFGHYILEDRLKRRRCGTQGRPGHEDEKNSLDF
jgi:hypothetical protein